ncbi:hypothetical protein AVEN_134700-1 [Araneus ventricosus]|uniref:Uncharacterized protein n=1 Tax=Araneus ventricosus TaxID=182803 RepID=A0A4Y2HUU6_ARAVE|nr:hypothetical protein AVEN_134700-1 [Araneus ventricosus]
MWLTSALVKGRLLHIRPWWTETLPHRRAAVHTHEEVVGRLLRQDHSGGLGAALLIEERQFTQREGKDLCG